MQGSAPLYLRESLVKQANTGTMRSNTRNLSHIPHNNLKRFDDRAFCAYAPCMQGSAPLYLRELLVKQANTTNIRSNTRNLSYIPHSNLKRFDDRAFCAYAPYLWNELLDNIKAADSGQKFKTQLKTLLSRK